MKTNLRENIQKLLVVLVIFAGFLFYMNWSKEKEPTFKISEDFSKVETEQKLMEEIKRQLTRSELASNYKLFSEVDYETVLIEERRTLKIEKAWFHHNTLHLIYSVDLKQEDGVDSDVPYLTFDEIAVEAGEGTYTFNLGTLDGPPTNWLSKGFVHKYRLYRGAQVPLADSEEDYQALHEIAQSGSIEKIRIDQPKMVYGSNENGIVIDPMAFDVQLERDSEDVLETVELNKSTRLKDNLTIEWNDLILAINSTRLTFKIEGVDRLLQRMRLRISKPNGEIYEDQIMVNRVDKDRYEVNIRTFREFPNEFSLEVTGLEFMEEGTPLSYTISEETIAEGLTLSKGEEQSIERKIGSKNGMDIYFGGLSNDTPQHFAEDGKMDVLGIAIELKNVPKKQFETWFTFVREGMQNLKYNNLGDSESFSYTQGPLIKITNQHGELANPLGISSAPSIDKEIQVILLDRNFVENTSEIQLELSHFPVFKEVQDNKTTFNLTSKGAN